MNAINTIKSFKTRLDDGYCSEVKVIYGIFSSVMSAEAALLRGWLSSLIRSGDRRHFDPIDRMMTILTHTDPFEAMSMIIEFEDELPRFAVTVLERAVKTARDRMDSTPLSCDASPGEVRDAVVAVRCDTVEFIREILAELPLKKDGSKRDRRADDFPPWYEIPYSNGNSQTISPG